MNTKRLVIAISSRALFDLSESHEVFEQEGVEAYRKYQIRHESDILNPGVAFALARKLTALNKSNPDNPPFDLVLLSRNSSDTGLRVFNSIQEHGLDIIRAAFTGGDSPYRYVSGFQTDLFLSADPTDVARALELGYAAASLLPSQVRDNESEQIRIAFDGDAVLFSDEAEMIYQKDGLESFDASEKQAAMRPLSSGPFAGFLEALFRIQSQYPEQGNPIRTALITARGAPAHERVIRTLRAWNIRIDEVLFLGGKDKGEFLKAFDADIYFDDQKKHCISTQAHVATGHVPHGINNPPAERKPAGKG
jgi:5'-nucleotidase